MDEQRDANKDVGHNQTHSEQQGRKPPVYGQEQSQQTKDHRDNESSDLYFVESRPQEVIHEVDGVADVVVEKIAQTESEAQQDLF